MSHVLVNLFMAALLAAFSVAMYPPFFGTSHPPVRRRYVVAAYTTAIGLIATHTDALPLLVGESAFTFCAVLAFFKLADQRPAKPKPHA